MNGLTLLALMLLPASEPAVIDVRADHCEVNWVLHPDGTLSFIQHIFYAADETGKQRIIGWKMSRTCKGDGCEKATLPIATRGGYVCYFLDNGRLVRVLAGNAFESTANFDHEQEARAVWPVDKRRGLGGQP